ncbi:unnamed protein product [Kuraishia capsulata CBS 1993]|uniref:Uncharacterized protein n=1 Tax=Kuraishia capsulata CBS 1993 TaxID=1382522 RepID=W6MMJ3_9ASCO|nr:uncharacterized protein KUCA_T00003793001 [Kuraishia capsulata CBS 1993]CDK27814.1 unnamed protein product [Kuraishia capsulata CBS 1993]
MKIFYIGIVKSNSDKAFELSAAKDLSQFGYFEKNG